jgi:hypothetical protein
MIVLWAQIVEDFTRRFWKRVLLGNTEGRKCFIAQLHVTQILRQSRRKIIRMLDQYMCQIVGIKCLISLTLLYSFAHPFLDMSLYLKPKCVLWPNYFGRRWCTVICSCHSWSWMLKVGESTELRDFWLPPQFKWHMRSSGMLRSVEWQSRLRKVP